MSCSRCMYFIEGLSIPVCAEGVNLKEYTPSDCTMFEQGYGRRLEVHQDIKDLVNPFEYWTKVPRHVRGITSHKDLVLTDTNFALFHNPKWLVKVGSNKWRVAQWLTKHLLEYRKKCKVHVYLFTYDKWEDVGEVAEGPDNHYSWSGYNPGITPELYLISSTQPLIYKPEEPIPPVTNAWNNKTRYSNGYWASSCVKDFKYMDGVQLITPSIMSESMRKSTLLYDIGTLKYP